MLCPSCSAASIDAYGRCPNCGFQAGPSAQPYAAYYQQPMLVTPTAPAGVGVAAQVLIAISGLFSLIAFGLNFWLFGVAKNAYENGYNVDTANAASGAVGIMSGLALLLNLATGIVFIVWFAKSAKLSGILAPGQQSLSSGWAIGGWFIPLAFLVLPRLVAGGIWRAARPLEPYPTGQRPRTYLVTWWWLTFCVGQLFIGSHSNPGPQGAAAPSVAYLVGQYGFSGLVDLSWVAASVLGVIMIRKVTSMQQVRILQGPGIGHPYAGPVQVQTPYAAYVDPTAQYPGMQYPGVAYNPAPQPHPPTMPMPMPMATSPEAQQQPVPQQYAPSIPPQAAAPADATPEATVRPTVPMQATAPTAETGAEAATVVAPQDAVPEDSATVVFEKREG
ncbi:hypothetical protein ABIA32_003704 [Streptacidiphilus sp. MAP12-20]|uniref:DUF4328 domain-containing protein n=1 Tax=Streptacidiphilus sp. MAP12-20 TaxID=3156299 RepID=UPI003511BAC3